jgi:hypothetical protein
VSSQLEAQKGHDAKKALTFLTWARLRVAQNYTSNMIRALALAVAMFSIGVDATTYTKMASYEDTSCTQLKVFNYFPESSSGTCTTLPDASSAPYSVKCDGSSILAYSSVDCSGSTVATISDTTTVPRPI